TAEKALQALYIEMRAAGYTDVSVTSGYRSYDKQEYLYNLYTDREMKAGISREEAQKIVDTYSARPGTSEHQTGLCCDMHNLGSASQKFAKQEVYTWLIENCYKFGFILRFPEGKEDITGYDFEPWHYRFVGRFHASEMHRLGMCLEEYVAYLAENE
ncbi:MAG: M15 family metallopeptidase, partial [Clostridia bacterium]|nr:M15 family metallopeptidase [Clostridia bacterium]